MPEHLTDEDLDLVAQMLIPLLEVAGAVEYPDRRERGCKIPGCDRDGYARSLCYPHDKERRQWTTAAT